jgi:hypothetical protein
VVIPAGAHHAWRNRSNAPIRMLTFFSPGGVEELYPKLAGLSLEELSTVVEPFGSGIVVDQGLVNDLSGFPPRPWAAHR